MIRISELQDSDVGRRVIYRSFPFGPEYGAIKSWNESCIFVRYGDSGSNGIATRPDDLEFDLGAALPMNRQRRDERRAEIVQLAAAILQGFIANPAMDVTLTDPVQGVTLTRAVEIAVRTQKTIDKAEGDSF